MYNRILLLKAHCLALLIIALCFSCSAKKRDDLSFVGKPVVDTLLINLPGGVSSSLIRPHLFNDGVDEMIAFYDYFDHSISILNLTDRAYTRKIPLLREGPDFVESLGAISMIDKNSLIVVSLNYLTILNFEGKVIGRLSINTDNRDLSGIDFGHLELNYNQYSGLQYNSSSNSVLMQISSFEREESQKFSGSRVAEIEFDTRKIIALDVKMPTDYTSLEGSYGDLTAIGYCRIEGGLVYNFPMSSEIFVELGGVTRRYSLNSDYADTKASPISDFSQGADLARFFHQTKSVFYLPVYHDSFRDLYYRIHKSEVNDIEEIPVFYLMIIDSEFNKLTEFHFPEGYYTFPIISREGLIFSAIDRYENKLELIRYKFGE